MRDDDEANDDRGDLGEWLDLAEDVARHHRQGHVLGVDPALVLRGLPPLWRRALDAGGPADDVVALAGVALARLDPADDDPIRAPLVEAAAGCLGADLPGLLRRVRPLLPTTSGPTTDDPDGDAPILGTSQAGEPGASGGRRPGSRVAIAGAVLAGALSAMGGAGAWWPGADDANRPRPASVLAVEPIDVAGPVTAASWEAPILTVDLGGVRYRYRLEGTVDSMAWRDDAGGPTLVVTAGERRWELAVPALGGLSATAAPR